MSTPRTLNALYKHIEKTFLEAGLESSALEARFILEERTAYTWADLISKPEAEISESQSALINEDIKKRLSGMPLSRIFGYREFWGMRFALSPDTLDPRPDTETLIESVLRYYKGRVLPATILDLGTGTGCILLALLKEFPQASGTGVDINPGAIQTAQQNAQQLGFAARAQFHQGVWLDGIVQQFDLIVSNPPYIASHVIPDLSPEVRNHDPILALDGAEDGLKAYREIFSALKKNLNRHGIAFFEIGYDQEKSIVRLVEEYGFLLRAVHLDLAGRPRVVEISCGDK